MYEDMRDYTQWWLEHPWHVTGTKESGKVPDDCDFEYCEESCCSEPRIGRCEDNDGEFFVCWNCGKLDEPQ